MAGQPRWWDLLNQACPRRDMADDAARLAQGAWTLLSMGEGGSGQGDHEAAPQPSCVSHQEVSIGRSTLSPATPPRNAYRPGSPAVVVI
jgi:hypothetical protein